MKTKFRYKSEHSPEPAVAVPALELVDVLHALLVVALHLGRAEVALLAVRAPHGGARVVSAALLLHVIQELLGEGCLEGIGWPIRIGKWKANKECTSVAFHFHFELSVLSKSCWTTL